MRFNYKELKKVMEAKFCFTFAERAFINIRDFDTAYSICHYDKLLLSVIFDMNFPVYFGFPFLRECVNEHRIRRRNMMCFKL